MNPSASDAAAPGLARHRVWILGAVWWFTLGGLGLFFPFVTLYLRETAGLTGTQVGTVMAVLPLMGLLAQPFWGQVADRTGRRAGVVCVIALGTGLGYAALGQADGFSAFVMCVALLGLFAPALLPNCVAVSLELLPKTRLSTFGRVRTMGTLGFAVSVGSLPYIIRSFGPAGSGGATTTAGEAALKSGEPGLVMIFPLAAAFLVLAAATALLLPSTHAATIRAHRGEWRLLLGRAAFVRPLVLTFLIFLFIQGPMVLFPILVRERGGGLDAISHMWLIMLALEVPLVFYFGASVSRLGSRGVIAIGIGAAALRWVLSGFVDDLRWVYVAQLLHGVTVWGVILGIPVYIDQIVPDRLRSTGQGLLAMFGIGAGSIFSNLSAGWLMETIGPRTPSQLGGLASFALLLTLPWLLPKARKLEGGGSEASE